MSKSVACEKDDQPSLPSTSSTDNLEQFYPEDIVKSIRLYILTWNVGGSQPPSDLVDAMGLNKRPLPDIYGIGLQEVSYIQEWVDALTYALVDHNFVRIKYRRQLGVLTLLFVLRPLLSHCTSFESEVTKTGMGGWWGNKGGVSVRMDIFGINLIIVNCHLAAHQDNVQERITDFDSILDDQKFKDPDVKNILDHDYVFWIGDLNFRLDKTSLQEAMTAISEKSFEQLLVNDQLNMCREERLIFEDFKEGQITFPPTYKFDVGTDSYDTSTKQRIPAWCDRVLWHTYDSQYDTCHLNVNLLEYTSHPQYCISDHKPVSAIFTFTALPKPPANPVRFEPVKQWLLEQTNTVQYYVKQYVKTFSTDWIGLYRANFRHFEEYITYADAIEGAETNEQGVVVTFVLRSLNIRPGMYCLCYLTKKYSLMGISKPFSPSCPPPQMHREAVEIPQKQTKTENIMKMKGLLRLLGTNKISFEIN